MKPDSSEKSRVHESPMRRSRVLAFFARHKFAVSVTALVMLSAVYFMAVYEMAVRADRISLSLNGIIQYHIPALKKEIPFAGAGSFEGCNYFTLRKCIELRVGIEIHQRPEVFVGLLEAINNPCRILELPELSELVRQGREEVSSKLREMRHQASNVQERDKIDRLRLYWGVRSYFDCDYQPEYERQTKKLVLNVGKNLSEPPVYQIVKYIN